MPAEKVLVLNATGKVGRNVCRALLESGFEVYGTTRSLNNSLARQGVKPVVCNYTIRADLDRAFEQTGAKKVFVITDYFRAARSNTDLEFRQGCDAIDAAKAARVDHLIFMSVADAECFDKHTKHLKAKVELEKYLRQTGDADFSTATSPQGPAPHVSLLRSAEGSSGHARGVQEGRSGRPLRRRLVSLPRPVRQR